MEATMDNPAKEELLQDKRIVFNAIKKLEVCTDSEVSNETGFEKTRVHQIVKRINREGYFIDVKKIFTKGRVVYNYYTVKH
jgi:predicted transcriptional regulator